MKNISWETHIALALFKLFNPTYTTNYFIDENTLELTNTKVLRGFFYNDVGDDIDVMIFASNFFILHHGDNQTKLLFKWEKFQGYFSLPPRGVDLKQSWELVKNLDNKSRTLNSGFDGHPLEVEITPAMIREALQLIEKQIKYNSACCLSKEQKQ